MITKELAGLIAIGCLMLGVTLGVLFILIAGER